MDNLSETIEKIIDVNNYLLKSERKLRELEATKGEMFFDLDKFLKEYHYLLDAISDSKQKLKELYKEISFGGKMDVKK